MTTENMIAYPNNDKTALVKQMRAHRLADELVRGETWRSDGETRGCAIGCLFHEYDHSQWPKRIGGPPQLAHLVDWLFEYVPTDHQTFPERVLEAIKPGADLTNVYPQWVCRLLQRRLGSLGDGNEPWREQCRKAIGNVRDLWSKGFPAARSAAAAARSAAAAWSAARSAAAAARSAAAAETQRQADDLIELLKAAK